MGDTTYRRCHRCQRKVYAKRFRRRDGGSICMRCADGPPPEPVARHIDVPLPGKRVLRVSRLPDVVVLRVGREERRQQSVTLIPGPSIVLPATASRELRKALGRVADVQ